MQLFAGPTALERAAGDRSPFSAATAGLLKRMLITDGTAYVDLHDLRAQLPAQPCAPEDEHAALRQAPPAGEISVSEWHSHVVRGALTAGWVQQPSEWTAEAVEQWDPVKVRWLALRVLEVHKELTTVPPE